MRIVRDVMRWSEVSHEHNSAPTIKNHSVTHFNGLLFCFGGYDGRRNHMTLLLYSIQEQRWIRPLVLGGDHHHGQQQQQPLHHHQPEAPSPLLPSHADSFMAGDPTILLQGPPPPGRNGHSATLAVDDEDNAKIVIIGGWLGTGPLAASDMHVLDVSAGGRRLRWHQPPVKGTPPGPCNMHSADYVAPRREIYVFRGGNGREYLNDLHALNVDTMTWRKVETFGTPPQPRANHSSAILEESQELCLFGGWNGGERLNDIHILNTRTSTWTTPRVGGVLPHPRAGMTLTAIRGRLMLFGGSGTSAKCFNDLQILDRHDMVWLDVSNAESSVDQNSINGNTYNNNNSSDDNQSLATFRFGGGEYAATANEPRMNSETLGFQSHEGDGLYNTSGNSYPDEENTESPEAQGHNARSYSRSRTDWRSREANDQIQRMTSRFHDVHVCPNPNDEDTVPTVWLYGRGPGRRAGHTATAVNGKIYVFGGSCGSDYLNDFFVLDTDPPPRAFVSEPTSLQLFERRLCHFFNDEEFSDVTFIVEGRKVFGHKMVLSIVSDCFRAMFTTGFRESQALEIEIPDCTHASFLAVMEYIYTGSLPKTIIDPKNKSTRSAQQTINIPMEDLERVVELLELADRFFLDHLKQMCESLLQTAVGNDTVEYLLSIAQKTNAIQLQCICEHFVRNRYDSSRATLAQN